MLSDAEFEAIRAYSGHHRELMERSERAGCFHCQKIFSPVEIVAWIEGRQLETNNLEDGVSALCPRCGVNTVLPSAADIVLDRSLLAAMRYHYFDRYYTSRTEV